VGGRCLDDRRPAGLGQPPQGRAEAGPGPFLGDVEPQRARNPEPFQGPSLEGEQGQQALPAARDGHILAGAAQLKPAEQR
jgi:hypothetical protein